MAPKAYDRSQWLLVLYSIIGFGLLLLLLVGVQRLFYSNYRIPGALVWSKVQQEAAIYDLEPSFVYAIVFAESSFRPRAKNTGGNGMMQVSEATWGDMSNYPYDLVWDWKLNIEVGTAYLGWCKNYLENKKVFSYPLLAACYSKGPDYVRKNKFDIKVVGKTTNDTYQKLFIGNLSPIE
ncbi:MAG: transglycosylase SLT domain-containing protein [Verrucomicrobia bacterium]|nr:transglycosylase SLT domain-containing protein [Verrucomicrobiota bacterium]MDA1068587.1 transglycosylase SLT domain-containing protein [Verrucomicrobiota bacterium]